MCFRLFNRVSAQKVKVAKLDENVTKIIITYGKPCKVVSADTIRRWIKDLFQTCSIVGITAHSCQSASTSKAAFLEINMDLALQLSCWKPETFYKHYLTHYSPVLLFYTPWKPLGFLMFSGGIEKQHRAVMG